MKINRSEYFANMTMGKPAQASPLCKVGKNFAKPGNTVCYNKPSLFQRIIKGLK